MRNQLTELNRAHRDLRNRFKQAGVEVDKDILRIEQLTEHIQQVFNDFALCFNSFVQREERLEKLVSRMEEMNIPDQELQWYLELRKFGTVPHSGFGLGFERLVQFGTGMSNIRDVIPFPRTPGNATF